MASSANQYIYLLRAHRVGMLTEGPTDKEGQVLSDHWNHLVELNRSGVVNYCGRTTENNERTFGIVIFQAESLEKAEALMKSDPAIRQGIMRAEVAPFQVFMKELPVATANA